MKAREAVCLIGMTALALCVIAFAQAPKAAPPVAKRVDQNLLALANTERAFAKLGAEKGVRESFIAYFAPNGIWFTPHPKNTIEELRARPAPTGPLPRRLEWAPMYGDVASSGEMGYDTGPSKVTDLTSAQQLPRYGYFFSIWKKQADGTWRVALDLGTQNPADEWDPSNPPPFHQAPASGYKPKAGGDPGKEIDGLLLAERAAAKASEQQGLAAASPGFLEANARFHHNFMSPLVGTNAIRGYLAQHDAKARWEPMEAFVAKSSDLGYTYGKYWAPGWAKDGAEETGYYTHVWRKDAKGQWRLVFHVTSPTPFDAN